MTSERPLRADARRNRDKILAVAVRALTQESDVTLDAIAKQAGVGIGTLYRHFPTREALVDAAYRNELAKLCDSAEELAEREPADRALRTWMDRFVEYMTTKQGMGDALRALIASGGNPYSESRQRMTAAVGTLLSAGAKDGTLRDDLEPGDVLVGLAGLATVSAEPSQSARLLDLLMDGLRYRG